MKAKERMMSEMKAQQAQALAAMMMDIKDEEEEEEDSVGEEVEATPPLSAAVYEEKEIAGAGKLCASVFVLLYQ
jgi:proline racemase